MNSYVGNLPLDVTEQELRREFRAFRGVIAIASGCAERPSRPVDLDHFPPPVLEKLVEQSLPCIQRAAILTEITLNHSQFTFWLSQLVVLQPNV